MEEKSSSSLTLNEFYNQTVVVGKGTGTGVFLRLALWYFEYCTYVASAKTNAKSLRQIYRETLSWQKIPDLHHSFWKTGFLQTIGKSASNMGVLFWVDHYYSHLSPIAKGLLGSALSGPFETAATSWSEYKKVQTFLKMQGRSSILVKNMLAPEFRRIVSATFLRTMYTGPTTFCGMYSFSATATPLFPVSMQDSLLLKAILAGTVNIPIQFVNMPIINLHTYVLSNPQQTTRNLIRSFIKEHSWYDLFRGTLPRTIHRSLHYGIALSVSSFFAKQHRRQSENQQENNFNPPKPK